ncbi:hypothetical protein DPQ33_16880 [Oceanidesulfovibrio indonesiensis]|uniref:Nitroreductase domain-containing protein n=1 Tax=Oceanidesulfovibrio indonesiensis TaxID=54767 RepID=A0A7M3MAG9_9BACT|nr:SagB family peptide dehydrogenase [Oceanidesulfovibrio indonesiensis]TVM14683.1 hypothetical protein DPQ33_16880 [Oceanidesulfovibrio indonesiensis]
MNAVEYHEATTHRRDRMSAGRRMDRATQPAQFKEYPQDLERVSLPRENAFPVMTMPEALAAPEALSQPLTMDRLARVLSLTCGLTASVGSIYLRSNPSAGALYPVEAYVAMPGAGEDAGGVFHYAPGEHALTRIRRGDGAAYAATTCRLPEGAGAPAAMFLFTTIFHRTAWKYGDRGYRYVLLDVGHVVENLLLACRAEHLGAVCVTDFADDAVNSLLGVDAEREVCQCMVAVYHGQAPDTAPPTEPRGLEYIEDRQAMAAASATVRNEPAYPMIVATHEAGNLARAESMQPGPVMDASALSLEVLSTEQLPGASELFAGRQLPPLARTMLSRRSQRGFLPEMPDDRTTQAFLRLLCDRLEGGGDEPDRTVATAVIMGRAEETAMYVLNRKAGKLERVRTHAERYPDGNLREAVADACLGQGWLARAAFQVLFLTDVSKLEATLGPRGYRRSGVLAGRQGERAYLAAQTLGMGACGVGAFFDDELAAALGLVQGGKGIYIVAAGPCQQR